MMIKKIKYCLFITLLLIFGCGSSDETINLRQQIDCLPSNLQNDIVAFYPFNNGSIDDESGNNYHLTNTTSASSTEDRNGNTDCAFSFDSSNNEFLEFTNPTFLNDIQNGGFTIALWYFNYLEGGGLIYRDEGFAGYCDGWNIHLSDNNIIDVNINGHEGFAFTDSMGIIQYNEWYHLVVTINLVEIKIYQNGARLEEYVRPSCGSNPSLNIGDLIIGEHLTGKLDDIIIYNRLLTDSEIIELYNSNTCCN